MVKTESISSTEDKILEAAKSVFVRNGLDGTTMQQIADEAGINKSLLHYYFRTKQKLFGTVLKYAFRFMLPQIKDILNSDAHVYVKIERMVSEYMDLLMKNSMIPAFILHEINRNPAVIVQIMKEAGINPRLFIEPLAEEIRQGTIRNVDPEHLFINMVSLCVFPIAARPLIQRLLFENNQEAYNRFLHERKKEITAFLIASIKL